jgi:hypothetical protein
MMRAQPFDNSQPPTEAKAAFRNLLRDILHEHKELVKDFGDAGALDEQVSEFMAAMRESPTTERIEFYRQFRIDDQRQWYANKAAKNQLQGRLWFIILVCLLLMATIFVLLRIAYPDWGYWPTEVFVVAAGSTQTWMQVKRFRELASAYVLAAHEIGIARGELDDVRTDSELSGFVADAESAFSREHTQWIARRSFR